MKILCAYQSVIKHVIPDKATMLGVTGSFGGYMVQFMETTTPIFKYLALVLGCGVAFLSFLIKFGEVWKRFKSWISKN